MFENIVVCHVWLNHNIFFPVLVHIFLRKPVCILKFRGRDEAAAAVDKSISQGGGEKLNQFGYVVLSLLRYR